MTDTSRVIVPSTLAQVSGTLLARTIYAPVSPASYSTTSATLADVDATNLILTFTARTTSVFLTATPRVAIDAAGGTQLFGWREGSSNVTSRDDRAPGGGAGAEQARYFTWLVTGLTAGNSYTYKLAWGTSTSTLRTLASEASPIIMEAYTA